MSTKKTEIDGIVLIEQQLHRDARGYVSEMYKQNGFDQTVDSIKFVQDYELHIAKNVVQGLHFQKPPYSQSIIVRCVSGRIISLALDLRKGSSTYGKCLQIELNEENKLSEFIPSGFAHGFVSLGNDTIIQYKCDNYSKENAVCGVNVFDSDLSICLPINKAEAIISETDLKWPLLKDICSPFVS
ncbi:MAG: dTDP-4-dehydrorhamnose 3,5-epimerase [Bacteroidales bacterium]|nr:dTDP-4-dehydrorhamnose 3,5-epimerase [Bacteroidales bacterium]